MLCIVCAVKWYIIAIIQSISSYTALKHKSNSPRNWAVILNFIQMLNKKVAQRWKLEEKWIFRIFLPVTNIIFLQFFFKSNNEKVGNLFTKKW